MTHPVNEIEDTVRKEVRELLQDVESDLYLNMLKGAIKHGTSSWKDPNNISLSHKPNHSSIFRHLAESYSGKQADDDSGLHPAVHLVTRGLMLLYRNKRGIGNEN
jgi:LytS/YehU family sensor histidine kinase